jgi:hypothetical protein
MKKMIIIGCMVLLTACSKPKTVEYFISHPEEMKAKLKACHQAEDESDECKNAADAQLQMVMAGYSQGRTRVRTIEEIQADKIAASEKKEEENANKTSK